MLGVPRDPSEYIRIAIMNVPLSDCIEACAYLSDPSAKNVYIGRPYNVTETMTWLLVRTMDLHIRLIETTTQFTRLPSRSIVASVGRMSHDSV
jgi:hypothetical protein